MQLHSRDDAEFWKGWKRKLFYLAPFLTGLSLLLYWIYFGMRIAFIVSAQNQKRTTFPLAWIFVSVEISVAIPIFLQNFWTMFALKKRRRPKLRLVGNELPTVDVFVTCCGEDDDIVLDTVRGACDQDWPIDRFRVIVLDDGKSASLEHAVRDLADTYPNLYYKSRPKFPGVPHHFKAGNLNYGLDEVHTMPGGAGQFMAALDADMVSLNTTLLFEISTNSLRFLNSIGSVPSCPIYWLIPRWHWLALHNYSTILLLVTLFANPSISSYTFASP